MLKSRFVSRLPYTVAAVALVGQTLLSSVAFAAKPASGDLDQCGNGPSSAPVSCTGSAWQNGNLNDNKAHYVEGQSVPYRLVLSDMPTGETSTVVIEYDVRHSSKHALDFLTSFDRTETDADPCSGVGTCSGPSLAAIPAPSSVGSPVVGMPTTSFNALAAGQRNMAIYNGAISSVSYVSQGDLTDNSSSTQVQIELTAANSTVVLAWGGHIGSSADWGMGNAAGGINGSPYHMRLISVNGGGGNQDRSLSAGAIEPVSPVTTGTLTVTKVVVNNDGGTAEASDFPLFVGDTSVVSGESNEFEAGSYVVSETSDEGYAASFSGDCDANGSVTVTAGQSASCVITNNDIAVEPPPVTTGTLTVTKVVVNNDGGDMDASDFPLFVGDTSVVSGESNEFEAGSYVVSETSDEGYAASFSGDCDADGNVTVAAGESASCLIINDDIANEPPPEEEEEEEEEQPTTGTLTVTKVVVNNDGGTAEVSDFPLFVGDTSVTSGESNELEAGQYVVSETSSQGYAATFSGDCISQGSVTVVAGETASCIITNDDVAAEPPPDEEEEQPTAGTLTVTKVVVNNDGGTAEASDFPLFVGDTSVVSGESNEFEAGSYVVSETSNQSYAASFSGDCDAQGNVTVAAGESASCVVTNNDVANEPPPDEEEEQEEEEEEEEEDPEEEEPQQNNGGGGGGGGSSSAVLHIVVNVVNDNGGTMTSPDFSSTLTSGSFSYTVTGSSAPGSVAVIATGAYGIAGSATPGYSLLLSGDCSGSVSSGDHKTCTLTYDDNGPAPVVLGATDELPEPIVLGATDELPRTGASPWSMALLPLAAAIAVVRGGFTARSKR